MTTFADASEPPVLEAVKIAKIPYSASFKFNNSALFASNISTESSFNSMFWDMGSSSFDRFFDSFSRAESKSLALTREVLREREQLETLIPGLQNQVQIGLNQLDIIQQEERVLKQFETEINANKNFTYQLEVTRFRKNKLNQCNYTCHRDCKIPKDKDKEGCWAMDGNEHCRVCPEKCHWSSHANVPYVFEYYQAMETHTSNDLKKRYDTAKSSKLNAEAMIVENESKLNIMQVEVYMIIDQARRSIKRLEEIALKPNPLTEVDYLDLLIQSEEMEARPGWMKRVEQYKKFRKDAEMYKRMPQLSTQGLRNKTWWQQLRSSFSWSSN